MKTKVTYYWHIHHEILCEPTTDIRERIVYIKSAKPMEEIPIRLRVMTEVKHPEKLPKEWKEAYQKRIEANQKLGEAGQKQQEAFQKWREASRKREEAFQKWMEASQKWEETYQKREEAIQKWKEADCKYLPKLEALHKKEHPDCPWNGKSIFNEE